MRLFLFIFLYTAHCDGQMGGGDQMYNNKQLKFVVKCGKCTGSIISKHYVLTAGHCVKDKDKSNLHGKFVAKNISIAAGDHYLTLDKAQSDAHQSETRKTFQADEVIPHPMYVAANSINTWQYDLALLYFKRALFQDGDKHIKSIEMVTADQRWNLEKDRNVHWKTLESSHPTYRQSVKLVNKANGHPIWITDLPVDHYKNTTTGNWVEYVPPAGSNCWAIGLGCPYMRCTTNKDGTKKFEPSEATNIKTMDEVKVQTHDTCARVADLYQDHDRNFCFGRGLRYGGRVYWGDSGGPVICNHNNSPPGAGGWKLYGVIVASNHDPRMPQGYTSAVRLTNGELNRWVSSEMQKLRLK